MSITHNYDVSVKWLNDRKGVLASEELNGEIEVATPPQFPNGMVGIWSPEHLFTAAVNSCLMTTFLAIAENSRLNYQQFESNASGKLEMIDGKYVMSEVTLRPVVTIENEEDRARAERVLQKSEQNCLISNSITSKIIFEPTVNVLAKSEVI